MTDDNVSRLMQELQIANPERYELVQAVRQAGRDGTHRKRRWRCVNRGTHRPNNEIRNHLNSQADPVE